MLLTKPGRSHVRETDETQRRPTCQQLGVDRKRLCGQNDANDPSTDVRGSGLLQCKLSGELLPATAA